MPFLETCRMEQRIRMLSDYDTGAWSVSELCRRYEVSRATFYAWRARRESGGADWFLDRSHAPLRCPHRTAAALAEEIVRLRRRFPHFGPRKLLARLQRDVPETTWPAASTIGDILKAAGLVGPVKRRRRAIDQARSFVAAAAPNDEWSADFKGWFRTRDGRRIDPLTLTDGVTRFLIEVRVAPPTMEGVRPVFAQAFREHGLPKAFREHGLPKAIRCDNGPPFGSTGADGLTGLSVWWLKLGIAPHFIRPASPQENGRHERMHRTLKEQTTRPAAATAAEQQARFDAFRRHYNEERPHEAIAQRPPAELYVASPRAMPETVEDPWYDADHQVRRVRSAGDIKWKGEHVFVGEAFAGELLGLEELETGDHVVRFCAHDIGLIDRRGLFRRFAPPRPGLREPAEQTANPNPDLSTISPVQSVDQLPG